jgi:hypothetical protein
MNTTTNDLILEQVRQAKEQQDAEDAAAVQALGNPLPGPTKEAMAVNQQVEVGRWRVRPMCDGDFEVFVEADHPLRKVMEAQFDMAFHGKKMDGEVSLEQYTPRGPSMWLLAWIMTRPPLEVRNTLRSGGVKAIQVAAEEEFFGVPAPVLVQIYLAVARQISVYWSPVISYGPDNIGAEDAAADAPSNPSRMSSARESTASAGTSRSGAG